MSIINTRNVLKRLFTNSTKKYSYYTLYARVVSWLPAIVLVLFMGVLNLMITFLYPTYDLADPARYQCYALTFWFGSQATHLLPPMQCTFLYQSHPQLMTHPQPPFHLLPVEYPPLALLLFSLPLLVPSPAYQGAFIFEMSLLVLLTYWLLLRYGIPGSALVFLLYLLLGGFTLVQMRYDLLPALMTLLCLLMAARKHWLLAYGALAFCLLFKLYPILLFPALFIAEQQEASEFVSPVMSFASPRTALRALHTFSWRGACFFFSVVVFISMLFAIANVHDALIGQIQYFSQRPVQIESSDASVLWVAVLLGMPYQIVSTFGSVNIVSPLDTLVTNIFSVFFIVGILHILWQQWYRTLTFQQASLSLVMLFVITDKIFSPQYLIWLIPLVAYVQMPNRAWLWLWGCISLLTSFAYDIFYLPGMSFLYIVSAKMFFSAIAARNIVNIFLFFAYLYNWFDFRQAAKVQKKDAYQGRINSRRL